MKNSSHWMAEQIVYQIFPDRFAIGKPNNSETKLSLPIYHSSGYVRHQWNELPDIPPRGKDYFGGDLRGIIDHLDYIQDLGATSIYLTPIFVAPSNHKYDTTDFFTIDPQFGDEKTLRELIEQLHSRKMRLFLDAVFNHVNVNHPWFLHALQGDEEYRGFFSWHEDGSYDCWRDYKYMPELNLANKKLQNILFRDDKSVLQYYIDMGVDGWRFDAAGDLGLPTIAAIRQALPKRYPDTALIGEIMGFPGAWTRGNGYHGVMNYYIREALLAWLRGGISSRQMNYVVKDYAEVHNQMGAVCSWSILSSHDTPRLRHILPDLKLRQLALVAQFTLPGVPIIYYGEEVGMDGGKDPDCRRPMVWNNAQWDKDTLSFYKKLIDIRQSRRELQIGKVIVLAHKFGNPEAGLIFIRHTDTPSEVALVAINNGNNPLHQLVFTPRSYLNQALPLKNLLDPLQRAEMMSGSVQLDLQPHSAAIFVPDDEHYRTYKFFKSRNYE